ncbi:MAG: hypothetical protein KF881_11520 [Acidobacteria bacterium]|nr:hypothetical protein [Acidobacteriota bacterium]
MELLIPGLILVALMVYASTRIKKTAAAAFEPETIETDEFYIEKPEGMLHVLNGDPAKEFESYSKEYGKGAQDNIRQIRAEIIKIKGKSLSSAAADAMRAVDSPSKTDEVIDGRKYSVVEGTSEEREVPLAVTYKLAVSGDSLYQLKVTSAGELDADAEGRVVGLVSSFTVK